jgi:hypothetical protein
MDVFLDDRPLTTFVRDVLTLDGHLAPAVAVVNTIPLTQGAGLSGSSVSVAPRSVTIGLDVWPAALVDRVTTLDTLTRAVAGLRLLRVDDAPTREMWVTLSGVRVDFYHISLARYFLELTFTAVDPTRYETEPVALALSTARTTCRIGTQASTVRLWLYGAATAVVNPVVIVRNAQGEETHRLTLTGSLTTNDALAIDSATQDIARYVAGTLQTGTSSGNAWLTSGRFPILAPEDAINGDGITIELTSTSGTATGLLLYTRGY